MVLVEMELQLIGVRMRSILTAFLTILGLTAAIELPTWQELTRHYPGYKHHNLGRYTNLDVFALIGTTPTQDHRHADTTALRLSLALNRLGGSHRLGSDEIHISKTHDTDSLRGRDGLQYIYRTTAYGPFLAMKYKSPQLITINPLEPEKTYDSIKGRRGIVRFVTFHNGAKHSDARILLWDCTRLYQSRDFRHMHHLISVEFWELNGPDCSGGSLS